MAGKPSPGMLRIMRLIRSGVNPAEAARRVGMDASSMRKGALYKAWKAEGKPVKVKGRA